MALSIEVNGESSDMAFEIVRLVRDFIDGKDCTVSYSYYEEQTQSYTITTEPIVNTAFAKYMNSTSPSGKD